VGGTGLGVATIRWDESSPEGETESRRWKETRAEKREPLVVAVALPDDVLRTLWATGGAARDGWLSVGLAAWDWSPVIEDVL
jgi:hypothetical protein